MTNLTFGAWLLGQEHRPPGDPVGELARHWKAIKGDKKIRSKPGVETALRHNNDFADGSPIHAWWSAAEAAWSELQGGPAAGEPAHLSAVPNLPQEQPQLPLVPPENVPQQAGDWQGVPLSPYALTGDSRADLERIYRHATGEEPPEYLSQYDRIEAKLDWLHAWASDLGSPGNHKLPPWPAYPPAPRIDWPERFGSADFDAQQA